MAGTAWWPGAAIAVNATLQSESDRNADEDFRTHHEERKQWRGHDIEVPEEVSQALWSEAAELRAKCLLSLRQGSS